MRVRRFSRDLKTAIPGRHVGLAGVPIQMDGARVPPDKRDDLAQRVNGLPILLDRPLAVEAMYLDPHGAMTEHRVDIPILFLVIEGNGFVRIGGTTGETRPVTAGDAVLWPADLDHAVWTEDEPLAAIVIVGPPERLVTWPVG